LQREREEEIVVVRMREGGEERDNMGKWEK